jgi:hypothetical protein
MDIGCNMITLLFLQCETIDEAVGLLYLFFISKPLLIY